MVPLIVLLTVFILSNISHKIIKGRYEWSLGGRIAMSVMLLFTASGHFLFAEGMAMMIPDFVPFKEYQVYATGVAEILAAIGLHVHKWRELTGWLLIIFFCMVLPANIYASLEQINYQTGATDGYSISYLWFRIPLQLFFIGWVYFSALKEKASSINKEKHYVRPEQI